MKPQDIIDLCDKILPGASQNIKAGRCPSCKIRIDPVKDFRDNISRQEFAISGLCQKCQDQVFTPQLTPKRKK